ncbi:hypothetical protein RQP46_004368 [Phenoliferia psychrophenolica]
MILRLGFVALAAAAAVTQQPFSAPPPPASRQHSLTLKHAIHLSHTHRDRPALHRVFSESDLLSIESAEGHSNTQVISTVRTTAWRPSSQRAYQAARRASFYSPRARKAGRPLSLDELDDSLWGSTLDWHEDEIEMPNITDVATLRSLAKLTSNAYSAPDKDWFDLEGGWNVTDSFGWLENGIRGHVFADDTNSTIVIAIKGTSAAIVGGNSPTGHNDKTNDNLLFSCCCARVDWSWSTVCDCYSGPYTCSQDCIEEAVMSESAYYPVATDLFNNVTALYPNAQIWLAGHSLGGSLAALLSLTYGVPSISFEAPGELLPARRLHLPLPPGHSYSTNMLTTHVYHTADPIAMGVCNGATSTCSIAGFALETKCHSGRSIIYDTVGRLGWSVDIRTHGIRNVIQYLFVDDWGVKKVAAVGRKGRGWGWWPGGGKDKDDPEEPPIDDGQHEGRGVPDADTEEGCVDCFRWTFPADGEEVVGGNATLAVRKSCGGA